MVKDIQINGWDVHFEDSKNGGIIRYQNMDETYLFYPMLQKHQQFYDIYKQVKAEQLVPSTLQSVLSTFRQENYGKQSKVTLHFNEGKITYMCIETGTRKFESNGNEVAITGKSKYSLGALTQTYHVVKKHDFPTEVDVLEWFKSTTINEFITKIDEWLKQFTTEQHEEKSEEQPSKQVEELTEQPEPSEAQEEAHE